jgi:hypothetical protein
LSNVPAGVTQEEGPSGFLIHLPYAVRALNFLARRIQPFLSLVDCEVEFCVLRFNHSPLVGHLIYIFLILIFIPFTGIRTHGPICQKVTRLLLSYRGELVSYQTYPKTIDSSRPLFSQVTPGRHAPIDGSPPLYHKPLPISSIHGYVTLSLKQNLEASACKSLITGAQGQSRYTLTK